MCRALDLRGLLQWASPAPRAPLPFRFPSTEAASATFYHRMGDCHATPISLRARWWMGFRANARDWRDDQSMACSQVPKLERVVPTAGQRAAAVGRERNRRDLSRMARKSADLLSGRDVPKLEGLIFTAG